MVTSQEQETVNGWLADLVPEGETLVLDDAGQHFILVNEQVGLALCVPAESDRFYLYADVLAVPHEQPARFYEQLLAHNAMPEVTLGLVLAFDRDARTVVALYSADIDSSDGADFRNIIGNMADTIISLRTTLESSSHEDTDAADPVPLSLRA